MPDKKVMILARIAPRKGFKPVRGEWVKEWPSGKAWRFGFDGSNPRIEDQHGRIIRDASDGITAYGLLANA